MTEQLYNTRILRLAASIPHHERLANPQATIVKVSPICGSRVTVDLDLSQGRVIHFGQEVRACALGQAAASLVAHGVLGSTPEMLTRLRDTMRAFLAGEPVNWATYEKGSWAELELFTPALPHRSRHGSILLAFEATAEAAAQAAEALDRANP